jgi:hypothetical protein
LQKLGSVIGKPNQSICSAAQNSLHPEHSVPQWWSPGNHRPPIPLAFVADLNVCAASVNPRLAVFTRLQGLKDTIHMRTGFLKCVSKH